MQIETFQDALSFVSFARMMKEDLPAGQWEDLKEIIVGYREDFGGETLTWSEYTQESFTIEVQENYLYWL